MWRKQLLVLFAIGSCFSLENSGLVPKFDLVRLSDGYHGLISEDRTIVEVQPTIRAGPDVCSFRISSKHRGDIPFTIQLKNDVTGEAELLARRALNCENRKNYKFDISAISCQGIESKNVTVRVKVNDVNEFAPVFVDASYVVTVDEGKLYDEIVTLRAEDEDCSPKFGDICKYELLTEDQPFVIDGEGIVRNTEPLDFERSHNHILSFVAYDCGMKRSLQPVMVSVRVNKFCHLGWKGIPKVVEYNPGSGRQEIVPFASLEVCNVPCDVERIQARISLVTNHIGKGCDRDTYSVAAQRKICGASESSIDLLPSPEDGKYWTSNLQSEGGAQGGLIFLFDGDTSGVKIPEGVLPHNLTNKFTLSSWMKHKPHSSNKHAKEHLICAADSRKMNRHHFALFVRNCRLILLLRREYTDADLNTFQPAEWRWKLPQVCDDEWHHYSVQAKLPEVKLFVDGQMFHPEMSDASEVIDDWPLHPTRGIDTVLSAGGCWQGSEGIMKHGLIGSLAGLSVLVGAQDPPSVLACLTRCQEALETPAMELLQPSMELLTNNEMTQITVEGNNVSNVETLIRRVAYVNSRDFPTSGKRPISISTNILCTTGKSLKVDNVQTFVAVLEPHEAGIEINGTTNFAEEYDAFRNGLRMFPDVLISLSGSALEAGAPTPGGQLDECSVVVYPPLNPDHEFFVLPDNLIAELGLAATVTRQGATVSGLRSTPHYQQILRQMHYTNKKPAYYLNRAFKLSCSELGGRFISNEYTQTVTVIHPQLNFDSSDDDKEETLSESATLEETKPESAVQEMPSPAHLQISPHHATLRGAHLIDRSVPRGLQGAVTGGASHAITIIVVVCIGFMVFVVALVVLRVRGVQSRGATQEDANAADAEMAWDDSALNITVNPMEMELTQKELLEHPHDDSSDDSSDEGSNFNDEIESSEDEREEEIVTKQKELEWDDSTLKI